MRTTDLTIEDLYAVVKPIFNRFLPYIADEAIQDFLAWAWETNLLASANSHPHLPPIVYVRRAARWRCLNILRDRKNDRSLDDLPPSLEPTSDPDRCANPERILLADQLASIAMPALEARKKGWNLISDLLVIHEHEPSLGRRLGLVYSWVRYEERNEWVWIELKRRNWTDARIHKQSSRARESFRDVFDDIRNNRLTYRSGKFVGKTKPAPLELKLQ